ncbi:hypothetical protein HMPREF3293_01220 [Christensenella minuta]|uniref:UPF0145 protein HMPREF3293_01220 n=2 Tax=Christensenella minuta TaxID=626937 RepID=A0A136Q5G3_9FIRM|nr:hypothetical protein HMPREF3293_01220 [Christensenella minuta]
MLFCIPGIFPFTILPPALYNRIVYYQDQTVRRKIMLLVTRESITGKTLEELGIVSGSTVQSVHIGKDFMAGFKTLVGGELTSYTEMMQEARKIATGRMVAEASALGADAVICMRYASSSITQGAAEIIAYGTAVKFKD